MIAFLRLSRPHFLLGGVLLFGVGAAAVGRLDPLGYLLGQVMVTAAQVTAHYVNEYADLEADRAVAHRTFFSGGSGVLAAGVLPPRVALRAGWASSALALLAAAALAPRHPLAAALGLLALAVSWAYSMPPIRLLGTGWGEVATSIVVVGLVPMIGGLSQGGRPGPLLWGSVAVLLPVHQAMLLAFELPDLETDRSSGKRVLAVRIGEEQARRLLLALLALAALVGTGAAVAGIDVMGAGAGLPTAGVAVWAMRRRAHGILTAAAVATLVLTAAGLLLTSL